MEYLIPPWKHQFQAIERAKDLPHFALFMDMGVGKSGTTINILRHKFLYHKRILRTLILCPPIVLENWRSEFKKHSKIDSKKIVLLQGSGQKRLKTFLEHKDEQVIFVANYESLLMGKLYEAFLQWAPEVLVFDESHKCKNHQAKRTKLATRLSDLAAYKYILSGTPILNSPMDIFSQFRILDGGASFEKNFFHFRAKYFYDKNAGFRQKQSYFPDWQIRPNFLEEINSKIFAKGMRVTKEECLDLPPLVRQEIAVEMSSDQAKLYESMKKDFVAYIGDVACVATMALTKALRLMQITSGYVKLEDGREAHLPTPKAAALKELLEELTPNHKVLVWAVFRENYAQIREICTELNVGFVEVHGDISPSQKFRNVDSFNTDAHIRVFIGHPGSGGIGINLVSASYSIFYSRTFSLEQDLQAEARNHRGGSEIHEKVTRIDLVCKGTIDELVVKKLASKEEISEKVLREISLSL